MRENQKEHTLVIRHVPGVVVFVGRGERGARWGWLLRLRLAHALHPRGRRRAWLPHGRIGKVEAAQRRETAVGRVRLRRSARREGGRVQDVRARLRVCVRVRVRVVVEEVRVARVGGHVLTGERSQLLATCAGGLGLSSRLEVAVCCLLRPVCHYVREAWRPACKNPPRGPNFGEYASRDGGGGHGRRWPSWPCLAALTTALCVVRDVSRTRGGNKG